MRKVYLFTMVSLDGFFEGLNCELDWHNVDQEFVDFAVRQLRETSTILFGRKTYQMMADFWSTEMAKKEDPLTAELMNSLPKIVFSKTLEKADWQNTRLVKENILAEIERLKESKGEGGEENKDIAIFGSSNLVVNLIGQGQRAQETQKTQKANEQGGQDKKNIRPTKFVIDEFRIMVNPVVLGKGHAFLNGIRERLSLRLVGSQVFSSGNVLLRYEPRL
jgi:dihydrofolate reductase